MEKLTLLNVLEAFNAPVNEEQAWAICYQCAKRLQSKWLDSPGECYKFNEVQAVQIGKDGSIVGLEPVSGITAELAGSENDLVQSLGVVVFQALDWGLSETEEHKLSGALEQLIANMTGSDLSDDDDDSHKDQDDEGIDADNDEDDNPATRLITLDEVIQACTNHLSSPKEAATHYKAVCRALINEAQELIDFLEKISAEKSKLGVERDEIDNLGELDLLERHDWTRLWMSIMRQLRQGVKLKKVEHSADPNSHEFELTPYEILMEDIRLRRYTLNKVMIEGQIPANTKKDAHEVILEFIRSRPPLHPVKDRTMKEAPVKLKDPREQMLEAIRGEHKLRPTPRRVVETSRTRLDEKDTGEVPTRKVIKPDLTLLMSNSFDEEDEEESDDEDLEDRNKVTPSPLEPLTPLSPLHSPSKATLGPRTGQPLSWQQQDAAEKPESRLNMVLDLVNHMKNPQPPERRHSITVCETPTSPQASKKKLESSLECLSLTIEEVMHIRSVLTKAELECLIMDPELRSLLDKGKVCFSCKKTKFSLFGLWATKCKFCRRNICSKCISKMRIPTEHFEHIPVYTLSPSPMSPSGGKHFVGYEKTGSEPSSPEISHKLFMEPPDILNNNKKGDRVRPPLQKSYTLAQPAPMPPRPPLQQQHTIQGPLMNICQECKTMVVNIIRASRTSLAAAPQILRDKFNTISYPSSRPSRNFHLDLKPVYKN